MNCNVAICRLPIGANYNGDTFGPGSAIYQSTSLEYRLYTRLNQNQKIMTRYLDGFRQTAGKLRQLCTSFSEVPQDFKSIFGLRPNDSNVCWKHRKIGKLVHVILNPPKYDMQEWPITATAQLGTGRPPGLHVGARGGSHGNPERENGLKFRVWMPF